MPVPIDIILVRWAALVVITPHATPATMGEQVPATMARIENPGTR
jgi:hypothetical protein